MQCEKVKLTTKFPSLFANNIHVWQASLSKERTRLDEFWCILNQNERARANRFISAHHRANFVIARGILRQLLGNYVGCLPQLIKLKENFYGKLSLLDSGSAIQFNLSHAGDIAMYAFAPDKPVGIDVEKMRQNTDTFAIASRFFAADESKRLAIFTQEQQLSAFFSCWTRKEAFIKALGIGLSCALDKFTVDLTPTRVTGRLSLVVGDIGEWGLPVVQWSLFNLEVDAAYCAALVAAGDCSVAQIARYDY